MKKKIIIILLIVGINSSVLFTHALYRNTVTGNGTLSAASWSVSSTGGSSSIVLTTGSTQTYTLSVSSNSQVDVGYSIELTNVPNGVQVKLDSGSYVTASNNKVTFNNAGNLLYGGTTSRTHTLTFTSPISQAEVSNQNVSVNVNFVQLLN